MENGNVFIDEIGPRLSENIRNTKKDASVDSFVDYLKLFLSQIKTLEDCNVPSQLVDGLRLKARCILDPIPQQPCCVWHIPFLPVIPLACRSLYDLMAMICNNNKIGRVGCPSGVGFFEIELVTDVIKTSDWVYYILDVEIGDATKGKSPKDARKFLKTHSRSPLTLAETIAVCAHTNTLSKHNLFAAGSEYESFEHVPVIKLWGGQPILDWRYFENLDYKCATASCGARL